MRLIPWLSKFRQLVSQAQARPAPKRVVRNSSSRLEHLEDRIVLSVAILGAVPQNSLNDVESKIVATGMYTFGEVDTFIVGGSGAVTPSLATLNTYGSVLVFSDFSYADPTTLGNNLASYVNGGGGVVVATFSFNVPLGGTWNSGGYTPISLANQSQFTQLQLGSIAQPAHPVMAGVTTFNSGVASYHNIGSVAPGASLIASWSNGRPLVVERPGFSGQIIGLNFYPVSSSIQGDFWVASTDGGKLMANALKYVEADTGAYNLPVAGAYSVLLTGGDTIEVRNSSNVTVMSRPLGTDPLVINGTAGNDTLVIDYSGGDPLPSGGLTFNGGNGANDVLSFFGNNLATATLTHSSANDGTMLLNGKPLTYTGLDPILINTPGANWVLEYASDPAAVTLADDGGGNLLVTRNGVAEQVTISPAGLASLTIKTGAGADTVEFDSLPAAWSAPISIDGQGGLTLSILIRQTSPRPAL